MTEASMLLVHLAVGHADAHVLAQKLVELFGGLFDVVDAVVEVVHLSAPLPAPGGWRRR
jgi:hypothetical protein